MGVLSRDWKQIAALVWPASLASLLFTLLEVADAVMLGMVGLRPMAGALLGSTLVYLVLVLPFQTLRAFIPLAAQQAARGQPLQGFRRLLLLASLTLGALAVAAILLLHAVLPWLGYEPDLLGAARTFLAWRAPFLPVELGFAAAWSTLEGLRGTRAPLGGGLAAIVTNLALNGLLIPRLGVAGAALATGVATLIGLLVLLRRLRGALPSAPGRPRCLVDRELLAGFVRIGWPLGLAGLIDSAGWLLMGLLVARAGPRMAAVHGVLAQLLTLGLALAQGLGAAGAVTVARAVGRGDAGSARRFSAQVLCGQLLVGSLLALAVVLTGERWVRLFSSDLGVVTASHALLPMLALMMLTEGMGVVLYGVVEGSGRTRILLHASLVVDLGFVPVALLGLGPDAPVGSFYQAWLAKSLLKLLLLVAWLEPRRWRVLLEEVLAPCLRPRGSSLPSRVEPAVEVGLLSATISWSALPRPDT